jgi:hypothetical protein
VLFAVIETIIKNEALSGSVASLSARVPMVKTLLQNNKASAPVAASLENAARVALKSTLLLTVGLGGISAVLILTHFVFRREYVNGNSSLLSVAASLGFAMLGALVLSIGVVLLQHKSVVASAAASGSASASSQMLFGMSTQLSAVGVSDLAASTTLTSASAVAASTDSLWQSASTTIDKVFKYTLLGEAVVLSLVLAQSLLYCWLVGDRTFVCSYVIFCAGILLVHMYIQGSPRKPRSGFQGEKKA